MAIPSVTQQAALDQASRIFGEPAGRCETIHSDGSTFSICRELEQHCREMGWSIGTLCANQPRAIAYKSAMIHKWDNISAREYCNIDAVAIASDPRNGDVAYIIHRKLKG
jgi:hypothetical protein